MNKLKNYMILDIIILVIGLGLCTLTGIWLYNGVPFEIFVVTGVMGAIFTALGLSLLLDMYQFRSEISKYRN